MSIAAFAFVGCGADEVVGDDDDDLVDASPPDALANPAQVASVVELDPLPGYTHASETTVAAVGGTVVVVSISQALLSADSFDVEGARDFRSVGAYVSHDRGASFRAPLTFKPGIGSTDPVVVAGADGTFWIVALGIKAHLWSSPNGDSWDKAAAILDFDDKPWLAVDPVSGEVYVQAINGAAHVDAGGDLIREVFWDTLVVVGRNAVGGYVDSNGIARFIDLYGNIDAWDGTGDPVVERTIADYGDEATVWTRSGSSIGETVDGATWVVRSKKTADRAWILVDVDGGETEIHPESSVAYLPAAATDDIGRLHVVWYDTGIERPRGMLLYTRSVSADFTEGFLPPIVVDDDAVPSTFEPYSSSMQPPGGRRLREYIGIDVEGDSAFVSWTHAPDPPSRVRVARIAIDP